MGLFPFFTEEENDTLELSDEIVAETLVSEPYREFELDTRTGRLTGRIVEGTEAVATWAILALKSRRYDYPIYSWEYGEEISTMIGSSYEEDLLLSEMKRMLEECLYVNEHIQDLKNLEVTQVNDRVSVKFILVTDLGDTEVNIDEL